MSLIEISIPRDIRFSVGSVPYALSNVTAEFGKTKVYITVSSEEEVPPWMQGRGSRTASLSGGYVALHLAVKKLAEKGLLIESPLTAQLAAIGVGVNSHGKIIADLDYEEDSHCEIDMNVVMSKEEKFIEVQGAAEGCRFSQEQLLSMLECAPKALEKVFEVQDAVLQ